MKGDRDSHLKMFKKARRCVEKGQEQKRKGDRDSSLNTCMFQNNKTGTENVQEQKRKGDKDSNLRIFKKARTGSENVQVHKMKGDRHSCLNVVTDITCTEKVKKQKTNRARDSHGNIFQNAGIRNKNVQVQKIKGGKDSCLNTFQNDVNVTGNVQEKKMRGERDTRLKGGCISYGITFQQVFGHSDKNLCGSTIKEVTAKTRTVLDQSKNGTKSKKHKIDSFSQYLNSLDDRCLSACSKSTISYSDANRQYHKSETDSNKSIELKKKKRNGGKEEFTEHSCSKC